MKIFPGEYRIEGEKLNLSFVKGFNGHIMSEFVEKPNLPTGKVTKVIADFRICGKALDTLNKNGIEVIKTQRLTGLYAAVCGHADMQLQHLGGNTFICEPTVFDYYKKAIPNARLIKGTAFVCEKYPYDIQYNGVCVGKYFFHNLKYTDSAVYEYYKSMRGKLINVKQGYTKCSVCVISENAMITSDRKIAEAAEKQGIDSLFVNPEEIRLNGMSNGFVGGICGLIDKNVLAVNGDVTLTSFGADFVGFCEKHGVELLPLKDEIPEDIGSILPIEQAV